MGVLHGLNRIFSRKSPHDQGQLAVGCRLNGKPVNPQHILRSVGAATIDFHNKLDVFHDSFLFRPLVSSLLAVGTNLDRLGLEVGKIPSRSIALKLRFVPEQSIKRQFSDGYLDQRA
jgi:hypothetical protein